MQGTRRKTRTVYRAVSANNQIGALAEWGTGSGEGFLSKQSHSAASGNRNILNEYE